MLTTFLRISFLRKKRQKLFSTLEVYKKVLFTLAVACYLALSLHSRRTLSLLNEGKNLRATNRKTFASFWWQFLCLLLGIDQVFEDFLYQPFLERFLCSIFHTFCEKVFDTFWLVYKGGSFLSCEDFHQVMKHDGYNGTLLNRYILSCFMRDFQLMR